MSNVQGFANRETCTRDENVGGQAQQDNIVSMHEGCNRDGSQNLHAEVARLKNELDGLKENAVIQQMREIKEKYIDLRAKYRSLCSLSECRCRIREMTTTNRLLVKSIISCETSSKFLKKEFANISRIISKPFESVDATEWDLLQEFSLHVHHVILHIIALAEDRVMLTNDPEIPCVCDNLRRGAAAPLHDDEGHDYLDTDESSDDSDA
ncbi:hypothetical protein HK104_000129, partial [Borealophlyctis nickersoniae]